AGPRRLSDDVPDDRRRGQRRRDRRRRRRPDRRRGGGRGATGCGRGDHHAGLDRRRRPRGATDRRGGGAGPGAPGAARGPPMTLVALTSVKGAPGVTTTVLAMAAVCPPSRRLVVVEADPEGGVLAARLGLRAEPGLVTLAA